MQINKEIETLKRNVKRNKKQLLEAQNNYILALAINETNIKIDKEAREEALKENIFYAYRPELRNTEEWGKRITNPNQDHNLKDSDFIEYCKIVDKKRIEKGLRLNYNKFDWAIKEPWNLSSDAESRPILKEAEKVLSNIGIDILPEPLKSEFQRFKTEYHWKHTPKLIKIIMSLEV